MRRLAWLKRRRSRRRMDAELQGHLLNQMSNYIGQGFSREEAELRARREFGSVELAKDECRDQMPFQWLGHFLRDVRYACRSLRKSPGFAVAAILTLALGVGANTAIFSVLDGVVLAPLPYREAERLVVVLLYNRTLKHPTMASYPDFADWRRNSSSLEQFAAFTRQGFDLTSPGQPEHLDGMEVSSGFFHNLGVKPALGREFSPEEDRTGGIPAAVISNRLWQTRFAGSPAALGKRITMDGAGYTIVGILRPGFRFDRKAAVYTPLGYGETPLLQNDRTVHNIMCIARLKPGIGIDRARAEMNTVQEHINDLNPTTEKGQGTYIEPLKQSIIGDVGNTLLLLLGAVGLVLLIACANVANLLLARSTVRARELAIRRALGASRAQVVRQLVTESMILSLFGGVFGLAIAVAGPKVVLAAAPGSLPRIENIAVNLSVLLFAFSISIAVGIAFGILPALKSSNIDLQTALKEGGRGSTGGHQRVQQILVVAQIALALVLLLGGSLLVRTVRNLWAVNPGFHADGVITFQVGLSPAAANTGSKARAAYQEMIERIRRIQGVEAASLTALVPLGRDFNEGPFWVGPHPATSMAEIPRAIYYPVSPDYLRTMEIPLLRGRPLMRADDVKSELVVLVDTLMARTYFPGRDAVGQTITIPHWGAARDVPARIVGVVGHVEHYGLDGAERQKPQIHYSFYQLPDDAIPLFREEVTLAVRTSLPASTIMPAIRKAVYDAGSEQPIYGVRTMPEILLESMASRRFPMILLGVFAVLALLLACVGIYGVISYSMNQRSREIGIRMALGAMEADVVRMVVWQGLKLAIAGIAIGGAAAFLLARVLSSFSHLLYGVRAGEPLMFAIVSLTLAGAALCACYIPAPRGAAESASRAPPRLV